MRIWKWDLQITDLQTIEIPAGAEIQTVQMQGGQPRIWAACDEKAPIRPRRIAIYGTGHPINDHPGVYIATFQAGDFVFHVFEEV